MARYPTQSLLAAMVALLLGACAYGGPKTPGKGSYQIMVVQQAPATVGYTRLLKQSDAHPDLTLFVQKRGVPDLFAETSTDNRRYFILYYMKSREAFACRTASGNSREVEFSGPYPITAREYKLLHDFQQNFERKAAKP